MFNEDLGHNEGNQQSPHSATKLTTCCVEQDLMFGEDEDFEICDEGQHNADDDRFDEIVGQLQEILIEPGFE